MAPTCSDVSMSFRCQHEAREQKTWKGSLELGDLVTQGVGTGYHHAHKTTTCSSFPKLEQKGCTVGKGPSATMKAWTGLRRMVDREKAVPAIGHRKHNANQPILAKT
eukprot:389715-Pelagomonas_calceolata.AAC.2